MVRIGIKYQDFSKKGRWAGKTPHTFAWGEWPNRVTTVNCAGTFGAPKYLQITSPGELAMTGQSRNNGLGAGTIYRTKVFP